MPPMLNNIASAPLLNFNMSVSVGPTTEAFSVVTPPGPFTKFTPESEAAVELVMSGKSLLRTGAAPPPSAAAEACIGPEPDGARLLVSPGAIALVMSFIGTEELP